MSNYLHSNNNNDGSSTISNESRYIITILVKYQKLNDTRLQHKEKQEILNELLNINAVELIDNFNHVLDESISNDLFESTYQMILYQMNNSSNENLQSLSNSVRLKSIQQSSCTVSICKILQRNNRDRIAKYQMSQVYYGVKDDTHIIILQLLDKMHCYFMHSFDFCLKWTNNEAKYIYNIHNNSDDMLSRIKETIDKKKQNISKASAHFDDNRYVTTIDNEEIKTQNEQKDKENTDNNHKHKPSLTESKVQQSFMSTNPLPFEFGKRWRYGKKWKTRDDTDKVNGGKYCDWFVSQKYTNLKRELLSNTLKKIPMLQWNQINTKAEQFIKCKKLKLLKAERDINYGFDDLNIIQNQSIVLQHIICILIYCNFSSIKNSFSDTYKPMNKYEQWKDVRSKHEEYANFGRILTETIECFGNYHNNNIFYHCLLGSYQLKAMQSRFFVPTSMTMQLSVITYYCYNTPSIDRYNNGLIIGLTAVNSDLKYFNCSFLSDFTNEFEVMFLGGKTLSFTHIYDIKKQYNYQYYIAAIHMIEQYFIKSTHNNNNINVNQFVFNAFKKCIYCQTQEAHNIPPQIDYYLNGWCITRKSITINMSHITQNTYFTQLLTECQLLIKYDDNVYSIYLDSLCRLFPNAMTIKIIEPTIDKKCDIFGQFHEFLVASKFYGLYLVEINLISPSNIPNDMVSSQLPRYFNSGWSIKMPSQSTLNLQTPGNENVNYVIQILKQSGTPRSQHKKSHSTPNVVFFDDDPFGQRMPPVNQSSGQLLEKAPEEPLIEQSELFENDSNVTDVTNVTQKSFTVVHIVMGVKKQDGKLINIAFDFNHDEIPEKVANDMINELKLSTHYRQEIVNVINLCITKPYNNTRNRALSTTNVTLVSFNYNESEVETISDENTNNKTEDTVHPLNVIHENEQIMKRKSIKDDEKSNDFGPTMDQKLALQQQQNMIKQKHVKITETLPSTHIQQQASAPITTHQLKESKNDPQQTKSSPHIFQSQQQSLPMPSIFDMELILNPFHKFSFPTSSVQLLEGKQSEFHAEFLAFLKTQSQIFNLKLEHIKIQDEDPTNYENETQKLVKSMEEKIDAKRKELTGKWDEFVQDQKELNELKQQISAKHLVQFKALLHFENQNEYQQIINSDKIGKEDKDKFRAQLKEFRDKMIEEYKQFREAHYGQYDKKLKEIQMREQQKQQQINAIQHISQHSTQQQYSTPQQLQ